jgi:site-specific DNA recombinase
MATQSRYFVYLRKSTDDAKRQVRSLEEQRAELKQIIERDRLTVAAWFEEKQSAKTPGRPVFNQMLARIEAGEANGVLAWHADRLSRNSVDGAHIIYLIDRGKLNRLQFYGGCVENTPQGKMLLNAEFGFSKYYIDSLSANVRRGHRDKVARGEYPNLAPLGYLNDSRTKRIVVDRDRAPVIRQIFERYAGGEETLESLAHFLFRHGITSRRTRQSTGGRLVTRNSISQILSNPLYYGSFRFQGEIHRGIHEPLIPKDLFDRVQAVLHERHRRSAERTDRTGKPFVRLFRCAECGCSITAEVQKGHTYYRCSKKKRGIKCTQPFIREECLADVISELLHPFALSVQTGNDMRRRLASERAEIEQTAVRLSNECQTEIDRLTARLSRLKDAYLDVLISGEEYRTEKARILDARKIAEAKVAMLTRQPAAWLEPFEKWLSEASELAETARSGTPETRRDLAGKVFGSNLFLDRRKGRGRAVKPWAFIADNGLSHDAAGLFYTARTYFQQCSPPASWAWPPGEEDIRTECASLDSIS